MALQVRVMYRTAVLQLAGIQWRIHLLRPQQTDDAEAFRHINRASYHLSRLAFSLLGFSSSSGSCMLRRKALRRKQVRIVCNDHKICQSADSGGGSAPRWLSIKASHPLLKYWEIYLSFQISSSRHPGQEKHDSNDDKPQSVTQSDILDVEV